MADTSMPVWSDAMTAASYGRSTGFNDPGASSVSGLPSQQISPVTQAGSLIAQLARQESDPIFQQVLRMGQIWASSNGYPSPEHWSRKTAEYLYEAARDAPALLNLINVGYTAALGTPLAARVTNSMRHMVGEEPIAMNDFYEAAYDVLNESAYRFSSLQTFMDYQAEYTASLRLLDPLRPEDILGLYRQAGLSGMDDAPSLGQLAEVAGRAGVPELLGRVGDYTMGKEFLWGVTKERFGVVIGNEARFDIVLDPGTRIANSADAYVEWNAAVLGLRHNVLTADGVPAAPSLGGFVGETFGELKQLPGYLIDAAAQSFGVFMRWKDRSDGALNWALGELQDIANPLWSGEKSGWVSSETLRARRNAVAVGAAMRDITAAPNVTSDDLLGYIGTALTMDRLSRDEPVQWFAMGAESENILAGMAPEQREFIERDISDMNKEDAQALLAERMDDRHSARKFMDDMLIDAVDALSTWDRFTQRNVMNIMDFFGDLGQGLYLGATQGWDKFTTAFEHYEADYVSEYFGIEDTGWAPWVNFTASLLGDPFVWITPGGKGAKTALKWLMTTPKGIETFVRSPGGRQWTKRILGSIAGKNPLQFAEATFGLPASVRAEIYDMATDSIEAALKKELAGGLSVPMIGGLFQWRNTGLLVGRLAKSGEGGGALARMFGGFAGNRRFDLGEGFMDDALRWIEARAATLTHATGAAPTKEQINVWVGDMMRAFKDYSQGSRAHRAAIGVQLGARRAEYGKLAKIGKDRGYSGFLTKNRDVVLRAEEALARTDDPHVRDLILTADLRRDELRREIMRASKNRATAASRARKDPTNRIYAANQRKWEEEVTRLRGEIRHLDEQVRAADVPVLPRGLRVADPEFQRLESEALEWYERTKRAAKEVAATRAQIAAASIPNSKAPLAHWFWGFLQEWGDELGLATATTAKGAKRAHPFLPGKYLHDWGPVVGKRKGETFTIVDEFDQLEDFFRRAEMRAGEVAGVDPGDIAEQFEVFKAMKDMGFLRQYGSLLGPANPLQIIAYGSRKNDSWWESVARNLVIPDMTGGSNPVRRAWTKAMVTTNRYFAATVLLNLFTFVRSNLDEPVRHLVTRGRWLGRQGIKGVTGTGEVLTGKIRGPAMAAAYRLGAPGTQFPGSNGMAQRIRELFDPGLSDAAGVYARDLRGMARPWDVLGRQEVEMVAGSRAAAAAAGAGVKVDRMAHLDSARQMFNGLFANDPVVKEWARAVSGGGWEAFKEWWDNGGSRLARAPHYTLDGAMTSVNASSVFNGMSRAFDDVIFGYLDAEKREWVRKEIVSAWAEGRQIKDKVLRQLGPMPNVAPHPKGVMNRMFDVAFGVGAANHGGLIFEDYYDEIADILLTRHQGRVLTPEKVAEEAQKLGINLTDIEAARHLDSAGSPIIEKLTEAGWITPKSIDYYARRQARIAADHMMYQAGATSLIGKRAQRLFPFGPAQYDFMEWYWDELMKGAELGLNPTAQQLMSKVPGLRRAVRPEIPFFGRPIAVAAGSHQFPLNLRLAGRIADLMGAAASETRRLGPEEEPDAPTPVGLLNEFTFFPLEFNQTFWQDWIPGLAPLPNWAIHWLPLDHDEGDTLLGSETLHDWGRAVRSFLEAINPALEYNSEQSSPWDIWGFVKDYVFAVNSSRSVGRLVKSAIEGMSPLWMDKASLAGSTVGMFGLPPEFNNNLTIEMFNYLEASGSIDMNSTEFGEAKRKAVLSAWDVSVRDGLFEAASRWSGMPWISQADDGQYIYPYQPIYDELDMLLREGVIGNVQADVIRELFPRWEDGNLSRAEWELLGDTFSSVLFDGMDDEMQAWFAATHPGINAAMVSRWHCVDGPAEYCRGERLVVAPGEKGREIRELGRNEGWLKERPPADRFEEAAARYATAVRKTVSAIWRGATHLESMDRAPSIPNGQVYLNAFAVDTLERLGEPVEPDPDGGRYISRQELADILFRITDPLYSNVLPYRPAGVEGKLAETPAREIKFEIDELGAALEATVPGVVASDYESWPEEERERIRSLYRNAVDDGYLSREEYDTHYSTTWGELDYEPPDPPPLSEAPVALHADPSQVSVVDGDTLKVMFEDGEIRVRLMGINAAEQNTWNDEANQRYIDQTVLLQKVIDSASDIHFVAFDFERFGYIHEADPVTGEVRLVMWLYVDGEPLYDPTVFTATRPEGIMLGGRGLEGVVEERETARREELIEGLEMAVS